MNKETKAVSPTAFFVLTFILSWSIWISLILASSQISEGLSNIVRLFGVLMPAVAAISLTAYAAGRTGIKQLFSRLKIWKVGGKWWLSGLLVYPVLLVAAGLLYNLFDAQNSITVLPFSVSVLIANVIFLTIAALGEEIGWRGVALPALQKKYSAVLSSLALGLLSAVWHLPFWLLIGTLSQFGWTYFVMNFLFIVPTTFFITWIFNNTKGSLLLPVAFHLAFNIVNVAIFPVTNSVGAFGVFIVLQFVVMLMTIPSLMKKGILDAT
jgi:membrane protease YdiL (CAAX protease family)